MMHVEMAKHVNGLTVWTAGAKTVYSCCSAVESCVQYRATSYVTLHFLCMIATCLKLLYAVRERTQVT